MSEKLGGNHGSDPEIGDFNTGPELSMPVARYVMYKAETQQLKAFSQFLAKDPSAVALEVMGVAWRSTEIREIMAALYVQATSPGFLQVWADVDTTIYHPKHSWRYWQEYIGQLASTHTVTRVIIEELTGVELGAKRDAPRPAFDVSRFVTHCEELHFLVMALRNSKKSATLAALPSIEVIDKCRSYGADVARRNLWGIPDDVAPKSFPQVDGRDIPEL